MRSGIVGHVILESEDLIVNTIVPSEELVAGGHERGHRSCSVKNVDEREFIRI